MMKESWWTMADLTELNFCSRQDLFDLTKEMSSCTVQLLKKYFKSKRSSLETSGLNGVALASAHTPSATPDPGRTGGALNIVWIASVWNDNGGAP